MKIAVNTRLLIHGKMDGIGWFCYETLKRITRAHKEVKFLFYFDRKCDDSFIFSDNIIPVELFPQARHPFLYYWFFQHSIPKALYKHKPDLFLSPDGYIPIHEKTKKLAIIHDLNFHHFPENLPWLTRNYLMHYFPKFAENATRIGTVSEYSKRDIQKIYNIDESQIDVVFNGKNELYLPTNAQKQEQIRKEYMNSCPYFLFLGTIHKRKNICNMLRSFDAFRATSNENFKFVLVGNRKWWSSEMESVYKNMKFKEDVIFLGYLFPDKIAQIIAAARALFFPSLFEGFGIPIIEAMQCEVPVITSDRTATKEIGKDAAILVDPTNVNSMVLALKKMAVNDQLRNELIQLGKQRAELYSWDRTASLLWESIEKTIDSSKQ